MCGLSSNSGAEWSVFGQEEKALRRTSLTRRLPNRRDAFEMTIREIQAKRELAESLQPMLENVQ